MRKNPYVYGSRLIFGQEPLLMVKIGIDRDASGDDPQLGSKRHTLVTQAAQRLADARMIMFDRTTGVFTITDLGRIAAKYYIRHTSIETFNKEFRPKMSEADVLRMLCMSTEAGSLLMIWVFN
jgi:antiviral helicase SLH1